VIGIVIEEIGMAYFTVLSSELPAVQPKPQTVLEFEPGLS
jgi:hypothetical protein